MSFKNRQAEVGKSYGIVDSYIQRYSKDKRLIYKTYGDNSTANLIKLQEAEYIDIFIEDKNVLDFYMKNKKNRKPKVGGVIPSDNIYVGFSPAYHRAQEFAGLIENGISKMRETGELAKIMSNYGLSDWETWSPNHPDPFAGDYQQRLEKNSLLIKDLMKLKRIL